MIPRGGRNRVKSPRTRPAASAVPDYCEPLIGWRIWHVIDETQLCSAVVDRRVPWTPFEPKIAEHGGMCFRTLTHLTHVGVDVIVSDPSEVFCSCGIHAYRTAADLANNVDLPGSSQAFVLGRVALWGTVAVHARGYRAARAYPQEIIYAEGCDGAAVAAAYGITYQEDRSWRSVSSSRRSVSSVFGSPYLFGFTGVSQQQGGNGIMRSPYMFTPPSWLSWIITHPQHQPWSSPVIHRPESYQFLVEPEPIEAAQPGLPAGMAPPDIVAPKRYQLPSGVWAIEMAGGGVLADLTEILTEIPSSGGSGGTATGAGAMTVPLTYDRVEGQILYSGWMTDHKTDD